MKTQRVFIAFAFALVFTNLVFGQTKSSKEVYKAYESWKQNHLVLKDADGENNKHQAVAVFAKRLDEKTASVQVLIVSEFAPASKTGFDVSITAQPKRIVQNAGEVSFEKAGYDSKIEGSELFPDKIKHVVTLPIMTLSVNPDSDAIVINFQLSDGKNIESQRITIPLKYEGYAMSIGRFASDYSKLRADAKWCGSCDTCARICTDCADGQSGDFNCVACTIGCH